MSEERALRWAAKHMAEGQYADDCHWVVSGWAVHGLVHNRDACTCRQVPKTFAPFLTAKAMEARNPMTETPEQGER